tara:strand:- start:91 stop:210 length:120 start_codon:yes stop_codon:yes gene_type:complete
MNITDLLLLSLGLAITAKAAAKISTILFHIDFSFGKISI